MVLPDFDSSAHFYSAHSTATFLILPPSTDPNRANKTVAGLRMRGMHANAWRYEWFPIVARDGPIHVVGHNLFATFYWEAHAAHAFVEQLPNSNQRVMHMSILDNLPWDVNTYSFPIGSNTTLVSFQYINGRFCHLVYSDGVVKYWDTFYPALPPSYYGTYIQGGSTSSLLTTLPATERPSLMEAANRQHLRLLEKHSYPPADPPLPVYLGGSNPPESESYCPEGMYHVSVIHRCKFIPPGKRLLPPVTGGITHCHETSFCPLGGSESRDYPLPMAYSQEALLHPSILPFVFGNSTLFPWLDADMAYHVAKTPYYRESDFHPVVQFVRKGLHANWEVMYPRHSKRFVEAKEGEEGLVAAPQPPRIRVPLPWQALSALSVGARIRSLFAGLFGIAKDMPDRNAEADNGAMLHTTDEHGSGTTADTTANNLPSVHADATPIGSVPPNVRTTGEEDEDATTIQKESLVRASERLARVLQTPTTETACMVDAGTPTLPPLGASPSSVATTSGEGKSTLPLPGLLAVSQHFGPWGEGRKFVYGEKYWDMPSHRTLSQRLTIVANCFLWSVPLLLLVGMVVKPVEKRYPPQARFWKRNWWPVVWRFRTDILLVFLYAFAFLTLLAWYLETFPVLHGPDPPDPHPPHIVHHPLTAHPRVPGLEMTAYQPEPNTGVLVPPVGRAGEEAIWVTNEEEENEGVLNWEWLANSKDTYDRWDLHLDWKMGFTSTRFVENPADYPSELELYYLLPPIPTDDLLEKWTEPKLLFSERAKDGVSDAAYRTSPEMTQGGQTRAGTLPLEYWETLTVGTVSMSVRSDNRFMEKPPAPPPPPPPQEGEEGEEGGEAPEEEPPAPTDFAIPHTFSFRTSIPAGKMFELEQEYARRLRLWRNIQKPIHPRDTQQLLSILPVDAVPTFIFRIPSGKVICPKYLNHTITLVQPHEDVRIETSDQNSALLVYPPVSDSRQASNEAWNVPHLVAPQTRVTFARLYGDEHKANKHPWLTVYPSLDTLVHYLSPARFYTDMDNRFSMQQPGYLCETDFAVHIPLHLSAQELILMPVERRSKKKYKKVDYEASRSG